MAGDWIKVESGTPDKPELSVMAEMLGIDQDAVFGKLFRIWSWADQNIDIDNTDKSNAESNADSVTVCVTTALLDRVALCVGFAVAMEVVGWLVRHDGKVTLPNFRRHNGKSAKNRALTAKRVAKSKRTGNGKGNAVSVTDDGTNALPRIREEVKAKAAIPSPVDFRADLFARWKALPDGGGGAFLNKLFRDHKPELAVMEAVERTMDEPRADPKAFVIGVLKSSGGNGKRSDGETLDELMARAI